MNPIPIIMIIVLLSIALGYTAAKIKLYENNNNFTMLCAVFAILAGYMLYNHGDIYLRITYFMSAVIHILVYVDWSDRFQVREIKARKLNY
ncbi:hypothetical protein HNP86_001864 [Methanococcus maripaludis]|uniref:Uncharacterized protein n=1 Tax=Methanococcus maripaludis TaxID=39152 RepID=A0A7J9NWS7_METMI|nr:hypothetical protein [Methanococcus maripaludis]